MEIGAPPLLPQHLEEVRNPSRGKPEPPRLQPPPFVPPVPSAPCRRRQLSSALSCSPSLPRSTTTVHYLSLSRVVQFNRRLAAAFPPPCRRLDAVSLSLLWLLQREPCFPSIPMLIAEASL
ncbi:hypothetical protein PIB30_040115 [Stylosanthes scabra]|uniref:Uncharacterized protein n=1 Tax=Stylosanthes scabra TaxID=79078 RepID=A0ABU6REM5_9FABA|nr:hypothetical protein [Stylosanthes scabra]